MCKQWQKIAMCPKLEQAIEANQQKVLAYREKALLNADNYLMILPRYF